MASLSSKIFPLFLLATLALGGCNSGNIRPQSAPRLQVVETTTQPATADTTVEETAPKQLKTEALEQKNPLPPTASGANPARVATNQDTAAPSLNLWQRLRSGFQLQIPNNRRVNSQIKWYATHDTYLTRVQERAIPYLHFIVEEVERRNMPSEMALLPIVESAFRPFAYSPGRAAGLWQFIPSTGKHFGLSQNWWYDGRRDVVSATRAALDYLQQLSEQFDGDWELALASYNAGAGTIRRAIKRNKKRGKPTDYWSLNLPKETMGYVPRLLAVAEVINNADEHGVTLASIPNAPYFHSVDIESQLDLALAADMAEISIEELYRLNPGFNRWATAPKGPHRLNIPVEKAKQFSEKLAELSADKRLRWNRYKIKSGDNLGAIALKYGTTVALLQQINKLKGNRIRAGKHLLIPVAAKSLKHYSLSRTQRQQKNLNAKRSGSKLIHRVSAGDTLWDIARHYKVGHKSLARWNSIAPRDTLRLGQKLVVWTKAESTAGNPFSLAPMVAPPGNTQSSIRYRVRKGDSLARIADRFNVSVADLRKWNQLPGKYLQPGQKIKLYVDVTAQTL